MKKQKIVAALLAGIMVLSMAACGNNSTTVGSESKTPAEESKETTVVSESPVEENFELTYPLDTDDTLTLWTDRIKPHSSYASYKESPFHTGLAERTGVNVEWIYPTEGSNASEQYTLLLTETTLPDIIFYNYENFASGVELMDDGLIYDLTDYLPKYAPDYWAWINKTPEAKKEVTTDDGRVFAVFNHIEGDYNATYIGPIIRQDWLDECGLEMPKTLEDWENVLVTFKEKYNSRLGGRYTNLREYGFSSGMNAWGTYSNLFIDDNGKVQLAAAQPVTKDYMTLLADWYDKDLIDKDILTAKNADARAKALSGEIGVLFVPMSQMTLVIEDAKKENNGAEWVAAPYPVVAEGQPTNWIQTTADNHGIFGAVITSSCSEEKLITALQFLNYGFTEEGMMYWNYGVEGDTYTVAADGKVQFTEKLTGDPDGMSAATSKYTGVGGNGISVQLSNFVAIKNNPVTALGPDIWTENSTARKHAIPSALTYETDANTERVDIHVAIEGYIDEMCMKFLTGELPMSDWDSYQKTLESMNYKRLLEIVQEAYDKYVVR